VLILGVSYILHDLAFGIFCVLALSLLKFPQVVSFFSRLTGVQLVSLPCFSELNQPVEMIVDLLRVSFFTLVTPCLLEELFLQVY